MKYPICSDAKKSHQPAFVPSLIVFALLSVLSWGEAFAQQVSFSKETFSGEGTTLQYQKANIPGTGDKASLVIYLHGGSSKGDDNETQMQEPAINTISTWLSANGRRAVMLVPQCPKDMSWLGSMQDMLVRLLQDYISRGVVDASQVYIFGGSMGGTGTWNMLANHPELFASAMPVAGNPSGLDAEAVSKTPLLTVMGTADRIMKMDNVVAFLKQMDDYGAEYKFNIEDGWTHEDVCKNSYTDERLAWVFGHTKETGTDTGIASDMDDERQAVGVTWFSVTGQRLTYAPTQKGVYIKTTTYSNGQSISAKHYIR